MIFYFFLLVQLPSSSSILICASANIIKPRWLGMIWLQMLDKQLNFFSLSYHINVFAWNEKISSCFCVPFKADVNPLKEKYWPGHIAISFACVWKDIDQAAKQFPKDIILCLCLEPISWPAREHLSRIYLTKHCRPISNFYSDS